jgi:hypothetical protein
VSSFSSWNRERREKAYTSLLEARDRYLQELRAGGRPGAPFPAYLWVAFAQVQLYGSEAAREAAVRWAGALMLRRELLAIPLPVRLTIELLSVGKATAARKRFEALAKEREAEESEHALRFQALLRKELGMDG